MALKKIGEYLLFFPFRRVVDPPVRAVVDTLPAPRETPDTARFVPQRSEPEAASIDGMTPQGGHRAPRGIRGRHSFAA